METTTNRDGSVSEKHKYIPNLLPTIVRFAKKINVDYVTVYRWAMDGDDELMAKKLANGEKLSEARLAQGALQREFCNAYKHAKAQQEDFLIQNGLAGASPSSAFIFTAKNITTLRDKVESTVTHKEERPLLDNLRTTKIDGEDVKVIESEE